ncbi:alpha-2-macroglobulin family protein [Cellulophaga sp. RHA19]|uniref:alpha-2-macroglobulin family protein n=1 Tax=Cellulophaga sp. RHA19 TaxID=1798237 RepID=UPI000C2CB7DC|nr:MG2 domain-containing protein [Cellulophaga sp. RHA19]PKB45200.1 alpha-2-macroglobulin family protein [Cellulophaga sp. RHA19]
MKNLTSIIVLILFANIAMAQENNSFDALWKTVEKHEKSSMTKSALETVQAIAAKAKKEDNSPQNVKALLYISKYAMTLEEDAVLSIITNFKSEIANSDTPTKNVLHSYLANLYLQYFRQNRYRFYNRTTTETKVDSIDFRTWDLTTLFYEIDTNFKSSLKNSSALQKIKVDEFDLLLNNRKDSKIYRPTLFDLLSHTALEFYKTDESSITRPADQFEIDDQNMLCSGTDFISLPINEDDKTSLKSKALKVYQGLLDFHKNDASPKAFVEVDLERLNFVYNNAVFLEKDKHYISTLKKMANTYKNDAVSGLYNYNIATYYNTKGDSYHPNSVIPKNQWKKNDAIKICEAVVAKFPKSRAAEMCNDLVTTIKRSRLDISTESYIQVNKPSKVLVRYKNVNDLNFTAYTISDKQLYTLDTIYDDDKKLQYIKKLKSVKTWKSKLKNEKDYQNHTTEVIIPKLNVGQLLILAEPTKLTKTYGYSAIQVTDLAVVNSTTNTADYFQVVNRANGKPIANATVKLEYHKTYNDPVQHAKFKTNSLGMVTIHKTDQRWRNIKLKVSSNDDYATFGTYNVYTKANSNSNINYNNAFLFTDRSIYRPGQPVYFKGIAINQKNNKSDILENIKVTVTLKDVNYQAVKSLELTTNEYGSFNGEFILPSNGLTGNFTIEAISSSNKISNTSYFSVEEYKRPKFTTTFKPVTETYKVNDMVTVNGTANAFAGSTITDAKVVYTVKRLVRYPNWYYWRVPYYNSTPQEIKHGETKTDANGNYQITFKAIPEKSVNKDNSPIFNYEITADVTDINGETKSTTTVVRVGYHSLNATINVSSQIDKTKKDSVLYVNTANLNGQFTAAKGSLKIYKLQAPKNVKRSRPWSAPDYKIDETTFSTNFPNEIYKKQQPRDWDKGPLLWSTNFDTKKSSVINLPTIKKWESGKYIIELEAKDKFGQTVTDKAIASLFSNTDKTTADNELFDIKIDKNSYSVGDNVEVKLLSAATPLNVTLYIDRSNKPIETKIITLSNCSKTIKIPITKEDIGGLSINYTFTAYNSFKNDKVYINVPHPSTSLEIETVTFRDKIQPGTDETWKFKIKGSKGDKVAAEILASMYDASLDEFRSHSWYFYPIHHKNHSNNIRSSAYKSFSEDSFTVYNNEFYEYIYQGQNYDAFNWYGLYIGNSYYNRRSLSVMRKSASPVAMEMVAEDTEEIVVVEESDSGALDDAISSPMESKKDTTAPAPPKKEKEEVKIRKNLQETAFFFPELQTDKEGNVSFNFTTPEALTKWKLQLLAHTKSLESAVTTLQTVTQKELMVMPNAPRFLREGDKLIFSSKIANITEKNLSGLATLELKDAVSGKDITSELITSVTENNFSVDAKGNTQVSWTLEIPKNLQAVQYTVIAKAGNFSDGEQNLLPVLTNRMLVTETLPMWVRSNQTKKFSLDKLKNNTSTTLTNHKLSLEITSNPAWYAVQALPYLMEYPHECNEQLFSRYYANTLASHIANSNPRIQEVFKQWANSDALLSNLEKNQELKSLLIQETPWLRDAQSETEQKKRIALLFNLNKMKSEQAAVVRRLTNNQTNKGGWAWFNGGKESRYITQHIITGFGHLDALKALNNTDKDVGKMINKAIAYLDKEFVSEYEYMKKHSSDLKSDHLSNMQLHYLYMRSFYPDVKASKKTKEVTEYYRDQAKKYWNKRSLYNKGLLALSLFRMDEDATAKKILKSLKQNSITSDELGMYWKENTNSWYWYQAPIETQSLLIEAFAEIENNTETVDNLKIWLLKNKQTNQWKTTKATTEAVYALLLQGSDWLSVTDAVDVLVGDKKIDPNKLEDVKVEAGTGYYKTAWNSKEIEPKMADVQITKKGNGIAWGAMYWQYFEDLDKITSAETPLKLSKKLFLKKNTNTGEQISEITKNTKLVVGDLVKVRIELRADRAMEFVHMKDMRASGLEPLNVISRYKWQDGLGYYESTKDASTNFFFDYLPKGVYVFEYDLRVNNAGDFSNGITTIQSMYAPEFSSHSKGVRVSVNK